MKKVPLNIKSSFGFTLLEIMIALAIIGVTLTVILHTVNFHAGIMYDTTIKTQMYQHAKEKMSDLETTATNSKGKIGKTGFTFENTAIKDKDSNVIELKTIVHGHDMQVTLDKLIINRTFFKGDNG